MAGNPDDYRFAPGEIITFYEWTEEEVLEAKSYFLEKDPSLWGDLKKIELDASIKTFLGTDADIRARRLLAEMCPDWQGQQRGHLWGKLRTLWRAEIEQERQLGESK